MLIIDAVMSYKNLKQYLDKGDVTEKDLAERLGVSIAYVNMLKRGERRPSPELAVKIESITGIPFRKLLLANENDAA